MLLNHLYTIDHFGPSTATLRLNAAHPIFTGHFPDNPILPGACQLQMIREMLSGIKGKDYRLQKAKTIKFITPIDPRQSETIRLDLKYGEEKPSEEKHAEEKYAEEPNTTLQVSATLTAGEAVCLKLNATYFVLCC
jgi:3-hydroxyacyl-[acyl-carrier-protein] dehydratase